VGGARQREKQLCDDGAAAAASLSIVNEALMQRKCGTWHSSFPTVVHLFIQLLTLAAG
jgi:hypothetical protein